MSGSSTAQQTQGWLYHALEKAFNEENSPLRNVSSHYNLGYIEVEFRDNSIVRIKVSGTAPPCPHCGHKFREDHADAICFVCKGYHTVCGRCQDMPGVPEERICFMEEMSEVSLIGQSQGKSEEEG